MAEWVSQLFLDTRYIWLAVVLVGFLIGSWLKKETGVAIFNPLLISAVLAIVLILLFHLDYDDFTEDTKILEYLITPTTVCLAIPLYKEMQSLKKNWLPVLAGILSGVLANSLTIYFLSLVFGLSNNEYISLLPKSITTAIGMGITEVNGGIVPLTVIAIVLTGIFGNIVGEAVLKLVHVREPVSKGLALGTSAHGFGTAKALQIGQVEGAMSSLSIGVTGIITVLVTPFLINLL